MLHRLIPAPHTTDLLQRWRGQKIMLAIPMNDEHKEYSRYAMHCLQMVPVAPTQEYRSIQRKMAAEWIKLADSILQPLKSTK